MTSCILAIDQGTTSSRALLFDASGRHLATGQQAFRQYFPANGWVEHDAGEIWQTTLDSCRQAMAAAGINARDIACIGITNQRETTIVWDRNTGEPVYRAIVWQDRRTSDYCNALASKDRGVIQRIQHRTGLLLDPYFSATKLHWILHQVPGVRARAEAGELAFGTVDSYLLWRLTGGSSHATDATNASRTMLFNIRRQQWDQELLTLFDIPARLLPEVKDCAADFGHSDPALLGGSIPITGMIGDQQAAACGQGCFSAGMAKSTYGTGGFLLLNTGAQIVQSQHRLLTTVACRLNGQTRYAIEGSIFMAGATMQWLRDGLQLIADAAESEALAAQTRDDLTVYLVPAFTGLGAPWWDPDARAALFGMTRDTGIKEVVTAALLAVCYQTRDLMEAIAADGAGLQTLRVDGGMVANNYLLQQLANLLDVPVHRPVITETTALGAAFMAGLQQGIFRSVDEIAARWQLERTFAPQQNSSWRTRQYRGWLDAVKRTRVQP